MKYNVVIIDYQLGNLFSVQQACDYLGYSAIVTSLPEELIKADFAILPGVGAFADAMVNLKQNYLDEALKEFTRAGKPLMGVCLGLQLLLEESEEFGNASGLGIIPGKVRKFEVERNGEQINKVPQIQWNRIYEPYASRWENSPLQVSKDGDFMYFVHSYYAEPFEKKDILSLTSYGRKEYCSSILHENIFATQFHPEKSGLYGVNIYKEWFKLYQ